jgi:hypothetical protein
MSKPIQDCYCHTCGIYYNHIGIARHRAAHRDRDENCEITYSTGLTYEHKYGLAARVRKSRAKMFRMKK